tara:strand:- start:962 stop:1564 length:603 start_codon:yes stop_codon:yes gene_type:complete
MAETINTATPDYIVDGVLTDGEAWVPLITNVLTGKATTITFQSSTGANDWSQYMDLKIVFYGRDDDTGTYGGYLGVQLNNLTSTSLYDIQRLYGDGSSVAALSFTNQYIPAGIIADGNQDADDFGVSIVDLFDINSGKHKTALTQWAGDDGGSGTVGMATATVLTQAPVTEIDLYWISSGDFEIGTRVDLFGILPRMVTA